MERVSPDPFCGVGLPGVALGVDAFALKQGSAEQPSGELSDRQVGFRQ